MTTTPTSGAADLPEALRLHALTAQDPSQPGGFDAGDMASAAAGGYRDGWTAAQAISAEPAAHVQNPAPPAMDGGEDAAPIDNCTDPYNCKRCKAHPNHRAGLEHAGIPAARAAQKEGTP